MKLNIIDGIGGDWFEGGIDKEPHYRTGRKSHMWKCTYHTCRALMNCIALLKGDAHAQVCRVANYWRSIAERPK